MTTKKIDANEAKLNAERKQVDVPESDPRLRITLSNKIGKADGVKSVTPALVNSSGSAAVLTAIPKTAPDDRTTEDVVRSLRATTIPDATKGQHMSADVGGSTAAYIDLADRVSDRLPELIGVVVLLSFILLLLAFRSIVVPLKAGVMNLISIGASYGGGHVRLPAGPRCHRARARPRRPDRELRAAAHVRDPLRALDGLRGLPDQPDPGALPSHSGQRRVETVRGLGRRRTARSSPSAALIMVCVFASFLLNGDPTVKQFGLGLAVAIAVDATIVRCLLVPAAMVLMKTGNWWFPDFLERHLPHLGIEGEEYFVARDVLLAAAAAPAAAPAPLEVAPPSAPAEEPVADAPPACGGRSRRGDQGLRGGAPSRIHPSDA